MKIGIHFTAALLATAISAAPATAMIKVATYTGTVLSGYDFTGEFGNSDTSLTGMSYVARFVYDTTLGNRFIEPAYNIDLVNGGKYYGSTTSPILDARFTLNGITKIVPASFRGVAAIQGGLVVQHLAESSYEDSAVYDYADLRAAIFGDVPSVALEESFAITGQNLYSGSNFGILRQDKITGARTNWAYAQLNDDSHLEITNGVPEPTSWVQMLIGFSLLGIIARRHRELAE